MKTWNLSSRVGVISGVLAILLATAGSVSSVAAKTIVVTRTTIYISTLPKGCVKTTYSGGIIIWKCGSLYYQPYKGRYVRVYIS